MSLLTSLLELSMDPSELVLRGTLMYWFLFLLFRLVLRRDVGSIAIADMLVLVLIADASQNAMSGGYETVADGVVLVSTIAAWNWLFDFVAYRFPAVRQLIQAKPLRLIENGKVLRRNLRKEMITQEELMAALRREGVEQIDQVRLATMESDGEITVVRNDST
ncbi:MAG: DUF421 domain-containing protein [Ramlibacter sp.]|nr:DUF421 domain-containing protein [Ramlibacter sp.]